MSDTTSHLGSIKSEQDAKRQGHSDHKLWLAKIDRAKADKKRENWFKSSEIAIAAYEDGEINGDSVEGANLFHANVETITPSIFNSLPVPELRVRFGGDNDPAADACEVLEHSACSDMDQMPFEDIITECVRKGSIVGEGTVRVRYKANMGQEPVMNGTQPLMGQDGQPVMQEVFESDDVTLEAVPWDRRIVGPSRSYHTVPWICYEHDMTDAKIRELNPDAVDHLPFASSRQYLNKDARSKRTEAESENTGIFDAVKVYEIWDRDRKLVWWISPDSDDETPIAVHQDPYRLKNFFPEPPPLRSSGRVDSLLPQVHYAIHRNLFEEFERISRRINALVEQLKVTGLYDAKMAPDFKQLANARDGQFFPATVPEKNSTFVAGSPAVGLSDAILFWPIEVIVKVIETLIKVRDVTKQLIWEATGIAEVMRGNSNPNKTLGATELEAQAGSMRVRSFQTATANFACEIIRIMIEIRANLTPWDYLKEISGTKFQPTDEDIQAAMQQLQAQAQGQVDPMTGQPAQPNPAMLRRQAQQMAQQAAEAREEEVKRIVRSHKRHLTIDVETDSTIRADITRDMSEFNQLIQATGQFAQAVGAMAPILPQAVEPLFGVFVSHVSKFRFNKQGEEALDRLLEAAKHPPQNPNAQQGMSHEEQQAQGQQQDHERQMRQQDMQAKQADSQLKLKLGEQKIQQKQAETQAHAQDAQIDMQVSEHEAQMAAELAQLEATLGSKLEHQKGSQALRLQEQRQGFQGFQQ